MPDKRQRWKRRLAITTTVIAAVLVLAVLAIGWFLPAIVRTGFERATAELGFEQASVEIDRADLSGLRATGMLLRLGGLEVKLDQGAADYTVRRLLGGQVSRVAIEGLTATLDFTRPRRGVLPDAIADLQAQLGDGGELVWPVDELELTNCRLVLGLPGGTETITISATASRQPDGRVTFDLRSANPAVDLHVSGIVRTETMDGEVTVHECSVQPAFVLAVARDLGLFELPRDATLDAARVTLSGSTTLEGGLPVEYAGRVQTPGLRATVGENVVTLDDVEVQLRQAGGATPAGSFAATLRGTGAAGAWDVGPARLAIDLAAGRLTGGISEAFLFAATDATRGRASLRFESGVPQLGGPAHGQLVVTLIEVEANALRFAPATLTISGWTDLVEVTIPALRLLEGGPGAATDFQARISNPADPARAIEGSLNLVLDESARDFLPSGWTLVEPSLPLGMARLDFRATLPDSGPAGTVVVRSTLPRVRVAAGSATFAALPGFELTAIADTAGAAITAAVVLDAVDLPPALTIPGFNAATVAIELPKVRYDTLAAVLHRETTDEDFAVTLKASAARSAITGDLELTVHRPAASSAWSLAASASVDGIDGTYAGTGVTAGAGRVTINSGPVTDGQLAAWQQALDPREVIGALAAQLQAELSFSAQALELPGATRLEWMGATFTKKQSESADPGLNASLSVQAGNLRLGDEVLEQPALEVGFTGDLDSQEVTARLSTLLEGASLVIGSEQHLQFDWEQGTLKGEGNLDLEPYTFTNSDVVSRWVPSLPGVAFSGTIEAGATIHYGDDRDADGTATVRVRNGIVNYPAQKLRAEGLFADVALTSWRDVKMEPGQRVGLSRVSVGDIVAYDVGARFRTAGPTVIHVEGVEMAIFDGVVTAEPFGLYFPDPDVALDLRMRDLDANEVVRTFEIFDGTLNGRLRGRLPVGLLAGRPIVGEGFLELEENHPASFSFDTKGLFTVGLPDRNPVEQINRLPYELLEDGLKDLQLKKFRVDLFRRDRPGTPVDIALEGVAHTRRADVPMVIDIHVNGSMREIVERLLAIVMK